VAPQPSQISGTYTGTLATSGSSFAGDNKTIAVTMNVTSQPIAQASSSQVNLVLAQGAPGETLGVALTNVGLGTLTVQSVSSTGQGFTATPSRARRGLDIRLRDSGARQLSRIGHSDIQCGQWTSRSAGEFHGGEQRYAVQPFQGVVDDAIFEGGDAVTPGGIVALFGDQLSFNTPALGQGSPLGTQIGTTQVLIDGQGAPLYYASYGQINLQIPVNTATGTATVQFK